MMGTENMVYVLALVALGVSVLWSGNVDAGEGSSLPADVARVADSIHWLGHDAMRIDTDDTVTSIHGSSAINPGKPISC